MDSSSQEVLRKRWQISKKCLNVINLVKWKLFKRKWFYLKKDFFQFNSVQSSPVQSNCQIHISWTLSIHMQAFSNKRIAISGQIWYPFYKNIPLSSLNTKFFFILRSFKTITIISFNIIFKVMIPIPVKFHWFYFFGFYLRNSTARFISVAFNSRHFSTDLQICERKFCNC